ncbi:MAG: hypothetical protein ACJ77K_02165 [Bacteroidia bacterium]
MKTTNVITALILWVSLSFSACMNKGKDDDKVRYNDRGSTGNDKNFTTSSNNFAPVDHTAISPRVDSTKLRLKDKVH